MKQSCYNTDTNNIFLWTISDNKNITCCLQYRYILDKKFLLLSFHSLEKFSFLAQLRSIMRNQPWWECEFRDDGRKRRQKDRREKARKLHRGQSRLHGYFGFVNGECSSSLERRHLSSLSYLPFFFLSFFFLSRNRVSIHNERRAKPHKGNIADRASTASSATSLISSASFSSASFCPFVVVLLVLFRVSSFRRPTNLLGHYTLFGSSALIFSYIRRISFAYLFASLFYNNILISENNAISYIYSRVSFYGLFYILLCLW